MSEPVIPGLILTRKPGEKIQIGADVLVEVVESSRGRVRLRIVAPPQVSIVRTELIERDRLARGAA